MQVLKGKKKLFFFIYIFILTTIELNPEKSFPLFKIKHVQFINNDHLRKILNIK